MRAQERLTSKNRRKGRATNTTLQTNSQKVNTMQTSRVKTSQIQEHHTVIWQNMEIDICFFVVFFPFSITSYNKLQENLMEVQLNLEYINTCKSTGIFFHPHKVRDKVSLNVV